MIFRFDNYVEQWATIYKPMQHDPSAGGRGKRMYRIDSINRLEEFAANLTAAQSPSVAVVTQLDGDADGPNEKHIRFTHRVFFFVKQPPVSTQQGIIDEVGAADAKAEGVEIAEDFLAYLYDDYKNNPKGVLRGIRWDTVAVFSYPQKFNGWWPTELVFEHLIPRNTCVNPEKYINTNT